MAADRNVTDQDYELLSAYLDNALSADEQTALAQRLQGDAVLRRELAALRQTVELIRGLPTLQAPRNFTLDARILQPRSRWLIFPTTAAFSALSAAAAVFLVLVGVILLAALPNTASAPQVITNAGESAFAVTATPRILTLTLTTAPSDGFIDNGGTGGDASGGVGSDTLESPPSQPTQEIASAVIQAAATATPLTTQVMAFESAAPAPQASLEENVVGNAAVDVAAPTQGEQKTDEADQNVPFAAAAPLPTNAPPQTEAQSGATFLAAPTNVSPQTQAQEGPTNLATPMLESSEDLLPSAPNATAPAISNVPLAVTRAADDYQRQTADLTLTAPTLDKAQPSATSPSTQVITAADTTVLLPTLTLAPVTEIAMVTPQPGRVSGGGNSVPVAALLLIVVGFLALGLAVATTLVRRRNR